MWNQIINFFLFLIAGTFVVQFFLPRSARPSSRRTNIQWDVAPMIGFFGALLLGLSFVESLRQHVVEAWAIGSGFGVIAGISLWLARTTRREPGAPQKSSWRATLQMLRNTGLTIIILAISAYLAIRIFGSAVEVFLSGTLGVVILVIAILMFVGNKQHPVRKSDGK